MNQKELELLVKFSNKRTRCRELDINNLSPKAMDRVRNLSLSLQKWSSGNRLEAYREIYKTKYDGLLQAIIAGEKFSSAPENTAIVKRIRDNIIALDDYSSQLQDINI